ncbi:MAG TPA: cytochrome b/b6 domain-containing protein [Acetobacteraceae bacterium]
MNAPDLVADHRPPLAIERDEIRHSLILRIAHWLLAIAVLILIGSGWRIYNASPIFPFRFPEWATLGGNVDVALARHNDPGVATAIAWHLAAIWLFFAAVLLLTFYGLFSGHFRRDWLPLTPRSFLRDFIAAARFRLAHSLGTYNAVQKAFYWGVLFALVMMLLSGLAIWKPVQLAPLTALFGGFQGARLVHFIFMSALALFVVVHLALVALVPKTLLAMLVGHASAPIHHGDHE